MPGNGDPQTPGIAALDGMFRRSYDDSELPPIPAHPMGYGDAIHFLKRIQGTHLYFAIVCVVFVTVRGAQSQYFGYFSQKQNCLFYHKKN